MRLDTPELMTSGRHVSWEAVTGASKYHVYVDSEKEYTLTYDLFFDVPIGNDLGHDVGVVAVDDMGHTSKPGWTTTRTYGVDGTAWIGAAQIDTVFESLGETENIREGKDLKGVASIAIAKYIDPSIPTLKVKVRLFADQEEERDRGGVLQVLINGDPLPSITNNNTEFVMPLTNNTWTLFYDLSSFMNETPIIRIAQTDKEAHHCVIDSLFLGDYSNSEFNGTATKWLWGNDFNTAWTSDVSNTYSYRLIADEWYPSGNTEVGKEGFFLNRTGCIYRYLDVTKDNAIMTLGVRSFGMDYRGVVLVNGLAQNKIGGDQFFSRNAFPGYNKDAVDGGENAIMVTYSLLEYVGSKVCITIANVGIEDKYDRFVIGSIGFDGLWSYEGADLLWYASSLNNEGGKPNNKYDNLEWMPSGVASVCSYGLSLRTYDFASTMSKFLDLDKANGKKVSVTFSMHSTGKDSEARIEWYLNGKKSETSGIYHESGNASADFSLDLGTSTGGYALVSFRIPTRNHVMIVESIRLTVTD